MQPSVSTSIAIVGYSHVATPNQLSILVTLPPIFRLKFGRAATCWSDFDVSIHGNREESRVFFFSYPISGSYWQEEELTWVAARPRVFRFSRFFDLLDFRVASRVRVSSEISPWGSQRVALNEKSRATLRFRFLIFWKIGRLEFHLKHKSSRRILKSIFWFFKTIFWFRSMGL